MDYLNQNLHTLKKHRPLLNAMMENLQDLPAIVLNRDNVNQPLIECHFGDGKVKNFYNGDPQEISHQLIQKCKIKNGRILIFYGLGLGYHLLEFLKNPDPMVDSILVIEPWAQMFKMALSCGDFSGALANPNIHFFIGQNKQDLIEFYNQIFSRPPHIYYANAIEYLPLPASVELDPALFEQFRSVLPQVIGYQFNRFYGDTFDNFRGTRNILKNMEHIGQMCSMDRLEDIASGLPGFLVASGPSLKETLPYLSKIENKGVIVACPSAIPALREHGIEATFTLNIERESDQGKFLREALAGSKSIFVGTPYLDPTCFKTREDLPDLLIKGANLQNQWLPIEGACYDLGQSSAHTAFILLKILGCSSIYLLGQDLCYQEDQSHAPGTLSESEQFMKNHEKETTKEFYLQGYDGHPRKTNIFWMTFYQTFVEYLFPSFQKPIYHVVHQDKGIELKGTTRIDPSDLEKIQLLNDSTVKETALRKINDHLNSHGNEQKKLYKEKLKSVLCMLDKVAQENLVFALDCKEFMFQPLVQRKMAQITLNDFPKFLNESTAYFNRFSQDKTYRDMKDAYYGFFFPIVQGMMIQYFIEFFKSADDRHGDFTEIKRKCELLHHIAKDEGHWAQQVSLLVQESLKLL